jgi:hypothetical protein
MATATLEAKFLRERGSANGNPDAGSLAAWCPYCEGVHWHGAAGRGDAPRTENRAPHCSDGSGSLFAGIGYDLKVTGRVDDAAEIIPDAPGPQSGKRLWHRVNAQAGAIRRAMLKAIVPRSGWLKQAGAGWMVSTYPAGPKPAWELIGPSGSLKEGRDMITLAAAVYGLPPGIAALRLIEAATAARFDRETAIELMAVLERWAASGAPQRKVAP